MKKTKEEIYDEVIHPLRSLLKEIEQNVLSSSISIPVSSAYVSQSVRTSETKQKHKLVLPIENLLGRDPGYYKTYFELEGGDFPDLWKRYEIKLDDVDSLTKFVSTPRSGRMLSALLINSLEKKDNKKLD